MNEIRAAGFDQVPRRAPDSPEAEDRGQTIARLRLETSGSRVGHGLAMSHADAGPAIRQALDLLLPIVEGREIEGLMNDLGRVTRQLRLEVDRRHLGTDRGPGAIALTLLHGACFDLWARSRELPLWKLLLDLDDRALVRLIDFTGLEELLTADQTLQILEDRRGGRNRRSVVADLGFPAHAVSLPSRADTQAWLEEARRHLDSGFRALRVELVGPGLEADEHRVSELRLAAGHGTELFLDARSGVSLNEAIRTGEKLSPHRPAWISEPLPPGDVFGCRSLTTALHPVELAAGRGVTCREVFKTLLQASAIGVVEADATRLVGGIGDFLAVSLLATRFPVRVVPRADDGSQLHLHLALFNHIALEHQKAWLPFDPQRAPLFEEPPVIREQQFVTPDRPGASMAPVDG